MPNGRNTQIHMSSIPFNWLNPLLIFEFFFWIFRSEHYESNSNEGHGCIKLTQMQNSSSSFIITYKILKFKNKTVKKIIHFASSMHLYCYKQFYISSHLCFKLNLFCIANSFMWIRKSFSFQIKFHSVFSVESIIYIRCLLKAACYRMYAINGFAELSSL